MRVPEKSFEPEATCPLDGVRVVDLSRLVSGNMVSLQLADFGAKVIKIVDPKRGDPPGVERAQLLLERETAIAAREARMRSLAGG
jgi:crotonobetainyl-CoA:carnitine CoA-transferase CaiB-like acyl-CoA transferase